MVRVETSSLEKHIFAFFLLFQVATKILFLCQSDSPVKSMHVNRWVPPSKCENSAGLVSSDGLCRCCWNIFPDLPGDRFRVRITVSCHGFFVSFNLDHYLSLPLSLMALTFLKNSSPWTIFNRTCLTP